MYQLIKNIIANKANYVSTYVQHRKKKGKIKRRYIVAPNSEYKKAQKYILDYFIENNVFNIHHTSYAWIKGKSRGDCANIHVGKRYVLEADIKNFYDSITKDHLIGLFIYNQKIPKLLNLLNIDLQDFIELLTYNGKLPQGFITSPHIANAIRQPIDVSIQEMCDRNQWSYSNYGDNLYISGNSVPKETISIINDICKRYGFELNLRKSKVMPYYQRQLVLGIVVNVKRNIERQYIQNIIKELINVRQINPHIRGKIEQLNLADNKKNYFYLQKLARRILNDN